MDEVKATIAFLQILYYREDLEQNLFKTLRSLGNKPLPEKIFSEINGQRLHPELTKKVELILFNVAVLYHKEGRINVDQGRLESFIKMVQVAKATRNFSWSDPRPKPFIYISPPNLIPIDLADDIDDISNLLINLVSSAISNITILSPFTNEEGLKFILAPLKACKNNPKISIYLTTDRKEALHIYNQLKRLVPSTMVDSLVTYFCFANEVEQDSLPHAKALIVDSEKGYLGSANFTKQGLKSRFEIGVELDKQQSKAIDSVLSLLVARRFFVEYR